MTGRGLDEVPVLQINAADNPTLAEMWPVVAGHADVTKIDEIKIEALGRRQRLQRIVFQAAIEVYEQMRPTWKGSREHLLAQLVGLVEQFLKSDRIRIVPELFNQDDLRRRILLTLNMTAVVHHIFSAIRQESSEEIVPVFDAQHPIRSTADMQPWYTGKPCVSTKHSHISHCVFDSSWESCEAYELDRNDHVAAWVKNDHLGFEILYVFKGSVRKYRPDFIVQLKSGKHLILEVKGKDSPQEQAKRDALSEWVAAVNRHGGFGTWCWDVSRNPSDIKDKLIKHFGEQR